MHERITITEIAKKANLSIATVSRAINPATKHLVRKSTTNKILSIIKKENYIPSLPAKRLATGKSNNIVVFFRPNFRSVFYNDYYGKMIAGSMNAVESTNYNLLISLITSEKGDFDVMQVIRGMDAGAAILCNLMGVFKFSAKNIFDSEIPILIINQYHKGENLNCFMIDNFAGGYDATSYLVAKGHRRIGFVRGNRAVKDGEDRFVGYKKCLADNNMDFDPVLCYQGDFGEGSGVAAAHYFFGQKFNPPSAVFCANDVTAISMMNELRSTLKVRCPRDISIIGFDGLDAGRYTYPALTTVRQPIYEMARDAVRESINIMENGSANTGTRCFKAKIIERGSVVRSA